MNKLFITTALLLTGCVPLTTSDMQSARLVKKGEYEITPSMSIGVNTRYFGLQGAYGTSKNINFRMRIERILISSEDFDKTASLTHLSFGNKFKLIENKLAFYMPISFLSTNYNRMNFFAIEPTVIFSKSTNYKDIYAESNSSFKLLMFIPGGMLDIINMGAGISRNMDKWIFRPEFGCIGLIASGGQGCVPVISLGLSVALNSDK